MPTCIYIDLVASLPWGPAQLCTSNPCGRTWPACTDNLLCARSPHGRWAGHKPRIVAVDVVSVLHIGSLTPEGWHRWYRCGRGGTDSLGFMHAQTICCLCVEKGRYIVVIDVVSVK